MGRVEEAVAVASIAATVAYSPEAGAVELVEVTLPPGATVLDALQASGLLQRHQAVDLLAQAMGIWGASCAVSDVLRDRDRVEIYRPLTVDPKEARRLRYTQNRAQNRGQDHGKSR